MPKYIVEAESKENLLDGIYSVQSELVLCKDCAFNDEFAWHECPMLETAKQKDNDFCSKGERRTNDCI